MEGAEQDGARHKSVAVGCVITLKQPEMAGSQYIFLMQATRFSAYSFFCAATQMFEMQLDKLRILEISDEIVGGPQ
jgi:hypothetical protein